MSQRAIREAAFLAVLISMLACARNENIPSHEAGASHPIIAPPGKIAEIQRDIADIDRRIAIAQQDESALSSGLNKALFQSELATLRQTRAMPDQRMKAWSYGIDARYTIDGKPFTMPPSSAALLPAIELDIAAGEASIAAQKAEVDRYGGLIGAIAHSTLATTRNTQAMLLQRRAAIVYELPQYLSFNVQPTSSTPTSPSFQVTASEVPAIAAAQSPLPITQTPPVSQIQSLESNYYDSEGVIRRHCTKKWPDDFEMREYCEKQQRESVQTLRSAIPTDVPTSAFAGIRGHCAQKWPDDFEMRAYCEKQQVDGYRHTAH
jgi:hypothetical protein